MPLFVPDDSAYMQYILPDLMRIVDFDTSIGDDKVGAPAGWLSITYNHNKTGPAQDQFFNIVHGTPNFMIMLKYVQSDFQLPEDPPLSIATAQGATYGPGMGTANPDGSNQILIFLDAYNCAGANYWVQGQDGSKIFSPRWVQLFHELSHALHISRGQVTKDTPDAQEDALTIGDENKLRAQYQAKYPWLKQRNLNEVGACGMPDPDPKVNNPTPKSGCFIVSAAYGSVDAKQVSMLKVIRDAYAKQSLLVGWFLSELTQQYYRFSPSIASEMQKSQPLKSAISFLLVEPLLCYFVLLDQYFKGAHPALLTTIEHTLLSQVTKLDKNSPLQGSATLVYSQLLGLRSRFTRQSDWVKLPPLPPLSQEPSAVLSYFFKSIEFSAPPNRWLEWAVMEPLILYWSALAKLESSPVVDQSELGSNWIEAVEKWLEHVPIPPIFIHLSEADLKNELTQVADAFFVSPIVRQGFAQRLLAQERGQVSYDLRAVLQEVGYLPGSSEINNLGGSDAIN